MRHKNKMMIKRFCAVITLLLFVLGIVGCGGSPKEAEKRREAPKLKIVTTIFPEYSWAKEILGAQEKNAELILLAKKGVDMHSYQPSAEDILQIASCDLFIYVGGESDKWADKALKEGKNSKRKVINLMQTLGERIREEETVEGMEKEEHHHDKDKHDVNDKDKHDGHDEVEYDEHVWLSLKNADIICKHIAEALAGLDEKNAAVYRANYEAYSKKLAALDGQYKDTVAKAPVKVVLFADRFPFRYLTDDYGLTYYAAFKGCSAETEASFATVAFLAKKTEEMNLPAVLTIEGKNHKLATTVVENTKTKNRKILTLHSLQSVPEEQVNSGVSYLKVMEDNLKVLQEALAK